MVKVRVRSLPMHSVTFLPEHVEFMDAVRDEEGKGTTQVVREALTFYIPFRNRVKRLMAKEVRDELRRIQQAEAAALPANGAEKTAATGKIAA